MLIAHPMSEMKCRVNKNGERARNLSDRYAKR